jgi:glutaredoxin
MRKHWLIVLAVITGALLIGVLRFNERWGQTNVIQGDYRTITAQTPVLYVSEQCIACLQAVQYAKEKGLKFDIRVAGKYPQWVEEMEKLNTDQIPVLVYPDKIIIGFAADLYPTDT